MSAFEISITPTKKDKIQDDRREPTNVIMAPFSSKAVVQFEDVPVSKTATRILKIFNPSESEIVVTVTKQAKPEHNLTIEWTEKVIPALEVVDMSLVWCPRKSETVMESMQLTDNRNFRKDVTVILKSVCSNPAKIVRKFPTVSSSFANGNHAKHGKNLRIVSPSGGYKAKPLLQSQQRRRLTQASFSEGKKTGPKHSWNSSSASRKTMTSNPLMERNIFENKFNSLETETTFLQSSRPAAKKSIKENLSPLSPGVVMDLFDKIQFTPVTEKAPKDKYNVSLLSPWQFNSEIHDVFKVNDSNKINEIKPRRLAIGDIAHDDHSPRTSKKTAQTPIIRIDNSFDENREPNHLSAINNKTFEMKNHDKTDNASSPFDGSPTYSPSRISMCLNKTTTITVQGKPLEIIQEEESLISSVTFQRTFDASQKKNDDDNLIRDVLLIGTPLRKFSESLKDLSGRSHQSKISTQGSMPNLNEMESIQSIEKNRYFHNTQNSIKLENITPVKYDRKQLFLDDSPSCNTSQNSLTSQMDYPFNHNEILAQSSRFNLNEIGKRSCKKSPISMRNRTDIKRGQYSPTGTQSSYSKTVETSPNNTIFKRFRETSRNSPDQECIPVNFLTLPAEGIMFELSPPKKKKLDLDVFQTKTPIKSSTSFRTQQWSHVQSKKFKLSKTLSLTRKPITPHKVIEKPGIKLYDSDMYLLQCINPDPFAATTTIDPFLTSTMYLDERAVDRHQIEFKKWLNALVSIPADLETDCENKVDVGKLFNEVRNKDLVLAPTKEQQSINYLTQYRLESLRRAAIQLFMSEELRIPCSKVAVYIKKNAIRVRNDRNLHLDVVMQRYILELLLCFNPIWLRLGLEVIYGEKIHLNSCSDIVGLSTFILNRLFKDKFLEQKYSKAYTLSEEYANHIKRFTLQNTLFLLLFLDKAKAKKIIKHNPCLFVKKSPHKETREILLRFSCEMLANVGDITRELRRLGYVLTHKQSFLDEFDYAFKNLGVDLRDGIRLTRVMEIILLRDDLTSQLRVPAISRLQRIFNVNLALRSLHEADFELKGDISAADIVDGHCEKTLSLLWQIIYKFRSPKFHAAATVIQRWWRNSWLRVFMNRLIKLREQQRREKAATIIQATFRGYRCRKFTKIYKLRLTQAAIIFQKNIRRYLAHKLVTDCMKAIIKIQHWYRAIHNGVQVRKEFLLMRTSSILLQKWFRRILFARKLQKSAILIRSFKNEAKLKYEKAVIIQKTLKSYIIRSKLQNVVNEVIRLQKQSNIENRSAAKIQSFFKMIKERRAFRVKRKAAKKIQFFWWSYKLTCLMRAEFLYKRECIVRMQRKYRANKKMKEQKAEYARLRYAAIVIQTRYRANKLAAKQRSRYLQLQEAVVNVQMHFRANLLMKNVRKDYIRQRNAIILAQKRFRATQLMKNQLLNYQKQRSAAICIQRFYRSQMEMRAQRAYYKKLRQFIIRIQQKLRATLLARKMQAQYISLYYYTIIVQQTFRATRQMRIERSEYLKKRQSAILIQRWFRANLQMRLQRSSFKKMKESTLKIQRKFRAYLQMKLDRARFRGKKQATIYIQKRFREYLLMKKDRAEFIQQKCAAIAIQRRYRATKLMKEDQKRYKEIQRAVICIQQRFRAKRLMNEKRFEYQQARKMIAAIQRRYRSKLLTRSIQNSFQLLKQATITIQQRYRANLEMRKKKNDFIKFRNNVIKIQRYFRSYLAMKKQRKGFLQIKSSAIAIQKWYRSILQMRSTREFYQAVRLKTITIQLKWRATLAARQERESFLSVKQKIILIQTKMRATLEMHRVRSSYEQMRNAAITIQRRYRANLKMLKLRSQYLLIKSLIICIQRKYRAKKAMCVERKRYLILKSTTTRIQQIYRGRLQMKADVERFQKLQKTAFGLQKYIRGYMARRRYQALMTPEMIEFLHQKKAVKVIQRYWRGYRVRKQVQNSKIRKIRINLKILKQTSQAIDSIKCKLQESVRILRGRFIASDALYALMQLDRLSRTVPHLLMSHCDFFCAFCYGIMAQTIRSEIDKQLIELCSRIILNLARYNSTTANTFQEGGLVTIAQMLMRWCDKDCEIFNTLCTLIWVFAHSPEKRKKIHKFMTTPEALFILRETKKLVARKEKMKMNARKITAPNSQFPSRALPSLNPDFGIIQRHPYIFVSAVFAFDTILGKLGIDIV